MASRPLPPGRLGSDIRSPVRPSVALRWTSNVAATSKDPRSPVKRWPPVQTPLQAPVVAAVTSKTVLQPAEEANTAVSAFQSARAVFEAKKTSVVSPPPPPPIRHRLAFHVEKQHSDLSASSCSTLDSESDRKLEESVAVNYEPEPSSPVRLVAKKMEAEFVGATPSKQNDYYPAHSVALSPPKDAQAPPTRENATAVTPSQRAPDIIFTQSEIDPFRLLHPVESVPRLPEEITCVYDRAATEMEKNIKKVVRKLLRKDKVRLEEFKVNSRLFGTDFMDSSAYLDTLIKDFGVIRALQLVPCLLSIQPNLVKSKALLLTAKNYLLRNEDELKRELQLMSSRKITTGINLDKEAMSTAGAVSSTEVLSSVATRKTTSSASDVVYSTSGHSIGGPAQLGPAFSKTTSPGLHPPDLTDVPVLMTGSAQQKANDSTQEVMTKTKAVEQMPTSEAMTHVETPPPLLNIAVSTPIVQEHAPAPVATKYAEVEFTIKAGEDCNLFGETYKPISLEKNKTPQQVEIPTSPLSPASSVHSFDEAESLFGERLSPSSHTSKTRRKSVTWGDTKTVETCDKVSVTKPVKKDAPLLFGLATAAAFESDEDESGFSD
ncbi:hypothetical protein P3T76_000223 [Phytophthora citrophthora]|uniref:ZNF598/HEL2 PAH domain-containing protein n=1 Tax=Phytophthora citrophthora TaxID=4793 RepID=A0AAD9LSH0_9STRA|nr:hypothetical protein P3T76_000223 [Phytophthora citrophthora]